MHQYSNQEIFELNQVLDTIARNLSAIGLSLNTCKTKILCFSNRYSNVLVTPPPIGDLIQYLDIQAKHLGILISPDLKHDIHITKILSAGNQRLGLLLREINTPNARMLLFISWVRSKLEYASCFWNPTTHLWSDRLEAIQRRLARRLLPSLPNYRSRLLVLELLPLWLRRGIQTLYSIHSAISNGLLRNLQTRTHIHDTRIGSSSISQSHLSPADTHAFITAKGIPLYNSLPLAIRDAPTVSIYKSKLSKYMADTYFFNTHHPAERNILI